MAEKRCSQRARNGRLGKARQFLLAAQLIKDFADEGEVADAYVTLCVHAGIAAADVICCARLGRYAHGDDHAEAMALLRKAGALDAAKRLGVLLGLKTKAGYTYISSTKTDVTKASRAAEELVATAERAA